MIEALKKLFLEDPEENPRSADEVRRIATAALLVEVARADFAQDAEEEAAMAKLLVSTLSLDETTVNGLLAEASDAVDNATSLYEFTRLVNDHYDYAEKCQLINAMWQVAYADKSLSKYEEHLIRRASELIYVNHEDFIRGKIAASNS
ncbi:TerB family tellurite resistance protein [Congregibacter brevis]|uniref:TerB family tellurite resistance protein n=1 Tax=Congregibacter brevis TaxID=3081201 RepID=A0ABZ0I879_9GAMM|nr:TerB family tellurite resistance protein [Congregibacter sp. IMCC45268]